MSIRFDDRVAIVTGAGHGLGRTHALGLAARGARVVVNDLGGARDGQGRSAGAAQGVVEEIRRLGGRAEASVADVTCPAEVQEMVEQTLSRWSRVDILVNNAGILRDKSFQKGTFEDFRAVLEVHLMGSVHCTHAVWGAMKEQAYGRVVVTTSSSGLYGNFGQSNYGAAKMALIGLMNTLVLEGQKYDIRVNALSPCAATRMTEDLIPEPMLDLLEPEAVTAGLLALASEDAPNRTILTAGAGTFARAVIYETSGTYLPRERWTPEAVLESWDAVDDRSGQAEFSSGAQQTEKFLMQAARTEKIPLPEGSETK